MTVHVRLERSCDFPQGTQLIIIRARTRFVCICVIHPLSTRKQVFRGEYSTDVNLENMF